MIDCDMAVHVLVSLLRQSLFEWVLLQYSIGMQVQIMNMVGGSMCVYMYMYVSPGNIIPNQVYVFSSKLFILCN